MALVFTLRTSGDHLGPLGTIWGPLGTIWGPSGDHLGNRFDEVIVFVTDPDLPECADAIAEGYIHVKQINKKKSVIQEESQKIKTVKNRHSIINHL